MKEYTFTITIRPMKWIKAMAMMLVVGACAAIPVRMGQQTLPHLTVAEVSRQNAYDTMEAVLASKAKLPEETRHRLARIFVDEAVTARLDPLFMVAMVEAESGFDLQAVSFRCKDNDPNKCYANARGLFQVIPSTWNGEVKRRNLGTLNKFDPIDNAIVGAGYFGSLATTFKRPDSLLLAWNQGPKFAVAIMNKTLPPEEEWRAREGNAFVKAVWTKYRALLSQCGLDAKQYRAMARAPDHTILQGIKLTYVPAVVKTRTLVASNP